MDTITFKQVVQVYWPVLAVSFLIALVATPICRAVAHRFGIVDKPDAWLKPHEKPVAYLGGVAIYFAWAGGIVFGLGWLTRADAPYSIAYDATTMAGILLGGTLIMGIGLFDDLRVMSPRWKLIGNIGVAFVLISVGLGDDFMASFLERFGVQFEASERWLLYLYTVPLTVFIVVGACNATNLLDGLDGLCSGVSGIIAFGFLVLSVHLHMSYSEWTPSAVQRVVIALAMMGGALGFLPYNRNPASIFMGDAGSILLGFNAALMILMFAESRTARWMIGAIVVVGLPIADMVLTLARRWRAQRPLMQGDRSHFYDQLCDRGYTTRQVVVISYALAALFAGAGCVVTIWLRMRVAVLVYLALGVGLVIAVKVFKMVRVDSPQSRDP